MKKEKISIIPTENSDTSNIIADNIFVVSRPESTNSLREIYVARYPNDKK